MQAPEHNLVDAGLRRSRRISVAAEVYRTGAEAGWHAAHLARIHALMAFVQDQVGGLVIAAQDALGTHNL